MSRFAIIQANAVLDTRLSPRDLTVLCALGVHADTHTGLCIPSVGRIGRMLGIGRSPISRAISHLISYGYVESVARYRADGGRSSNRYRVLYDAVPNVCFLRDAGGSARLDRSVEAAAATPVGDAHPPVSPATHPPVSLAPHSPVSPATHPCASTNTPPMSVTDTPITPHIDEEEDECARGRADTADGQDAAVPGENDLPSWVPRGTWHDFYAHRLVLRRPLSIPGQRQVVRRLQALRDAGHDITASLEETMAAGLSMPVQPHPQGGHPHENRHPEHKLSACERTEERIRAARAARANDAGADDDGALVGADAW